MRKPAIYVFLVLAAFATNGDYHISSSAIASADQAKPELVTQTGHVNAVFSIAISPDKKWIATGGNDSAVKIWDLATGRELRALAGHDGAVKSVVISPDGGMLASGGNDGKVRIWNVITGAEVGGFVPVEGKVTVEAVAISRDGKRIAAGGSGKVIVVRDLTTGTDIARLTGHGPISALAFSPDGQTLASGSSDKSVRIWDIAKATSKGPLTGHADKIISLAFNETGDVLASGGSDEDKSVRLWKVADGTGLGVDRAHAGAVQALYFSGASRLVSGDADRSTKAWDISVTTPPAERGKPVGDKVNSASAAAFSADGALLATGEGGGNSVIFESATGNQIAALENYTFGFNSVAFSSDRQWMAAASRDKSVKLWDLETGESLPAKRGHKGFVTAVVFQPGTPSRRMISGGNDGRVIIWDTLLPNPVENYPAHINEKSGQGFSVNSLAVGGKGKLLVSGSSDKRIAVWNLDEPKPLPRYLTDHKGDVRSVAITADERLIASASTDGTVRIWDTGTWTSAPVEPPAGSYSAVAISSDGKIVAGGGTDAKIRIWEVESRRLLHTLQGHSAEILSLQFSPDGAQLASSSFDKTARTWNVASGQPVGALAEHAASVPSTTFSPDGKWLTTASHDGTLMAWAAGTGERVASLISLRNGEDWLVVTPPGFFDGSPLSYSQLSWRFERDTFNVKPVEIFFHEFYKPGLLSDLFNNKPLPNANISNKDRRQPELLLTRLEAEPGANSGVMGVRIDITKSPAGAKDVRLFRNGTLVKIWRGEQVKAGRTAPLEYFVPIVAGPNRISAYAFNKDDVKSQDAWLNITGPPELAKKGVSYILAIGVDSYANKSFDLKVAVKDARTFAQEFKSQQDKLATADRVEPIIVPNDQATKKNILNKLAELAAKVKPEDSLTIFYAGHGLAVDQRFYLIPHDIGYQGTPPIEPDEFQKLVGNWVSDIEIGDAVEGIDAGQMLLVIDACNSGKALDVEEKRRGPMNSKGLAQLAYEKGMYILTASQGFQDAKEDVQLGHGYLTYALVVDGLGKRAADRNKDNKILLREWLDYATDRVPEIDRGEILNGGKEARRGLSREKGTTGLKTLALQRPRVFYRRESETTPIVVAKY